MKWRTGSLGAALFLVATAAGAEPSRTSRAADKNPAPAPESPAASSTAGLASDRRIRTDRPPTDPAALRAEGKLERTTGLVLTAIGVTLGAAGAAMLAAGATPRGTAGSSALTPAGGVCVALGGLSLLVGVPMTITGLIDLNAAPPPLALALVVGPQGGGLRFSF